MEELKELIALLNTYSYEYYTLGKSTIQDIEYDKLYNKLVKLEKETGMILSNSPTQNVGGEVLPNLKKVTHKYPMLSLDKCHEVDKILDFSKDKRIIAMLKLDGLTTDISYDGNGILETGETRGNGVIGEDITHNVKTYKNIPLQISSQNYIHIIGESILDYNEFEKINNSLPLGCDKYKNPRNLCSGSVRQLNSDICKDRNIKFYGYIVRGMEFNTKQEQLEYIKRLGFDVCDYVIIEKDKLNKEYIEAVISRLKKIAGDKKIPIDGIVFQYDDINYCKSLGVTSHHPLHSIAYKFYDDVQETVITNIKWQIGRTGIVTPVAEFETVEIDGTDVSKASVHNLTILKELNINIGSKVTVKKANMIIPQIEDNLTKTTDILIDIPTICHVCGEPLIIKKDTDSEFLYCSNPNCKAKLIQSISHYCSRDAMNIIGLSGKTIEKFIEKGFINNIKDIYSLEKHRDEIINMDGLGLRSFNKLIESIKKSKLCKLESFIFSLGIPNVGLQTAKNIVEFATEDDNVYQTIRNITQYTKKSWLDMKDCGDILAKNLNDYFSDKNNINIFDELLLKLTFIKDEPKQSYKGVLKGLKIYPTGTFSSLKKNDIKKLIEDNGGLMTSGYTKSLDYLIVGSVKGSDKENKALEDKVKILKEQEFFDILK